MMKLRWKKEYIQDFCPLDFPDWNLYGLVPVRLNEHKIAMCRLEYFDEQVQEWLCLPIEFD